MFTGIITNIGIIEELKEVGSDIELIITSDLNISEITLGQSIGCNGCCLTVANIAENKLSFFISKESISKSNFSLAKKGDKVNLELAMQIGDRFDGHIVSGHVDTVATILDISKDNESHIIKLSLPDDYIDYLIPKGSVTLNGISLTVNEVTEEFFTVNIIPHSWNATNLSDLKAEDEVNYEVDMVAKYIKKFANAK